ncbi:hypothetical protein PUNSTDRAFT_124864 [Punctularia strigosozonata HHB-11173 SS5]|uniref:uncharacterized protein n=1 Tax=Punctularia strigosozonata (strain HHB-11173) TaxID=741275 RepID=UPI00044170BE|nr:uncharacterized protein PUNSTDRAFT_124864 [Punctularia strigosozonata HHB-11173 SS5]EIN11573.1 hypothetical protein PUNSTDRAFT_124864 [Punctularia strigosozonata HHB-11173 SS5]
MLRRFLLPRIPIAALRTATPMTTTRASGRLGHPTHHPSVRRRPRDTQRQGPVQDIASQRVIAASEARRKNPPQWSCPICQQTFTTRTNCEDHMRAHSNQRPFKCDDCEKAFARKHELKRHQRTIHSTERPYQCDICGAGYARSDQRTRHMANCNGNPSTE